MSRIVTTYVNFRKCPISFHGSFRSLRCFLSSLMNIAVEMDHGWQRSLSFWHKPSVAMIAGGIGCQETQQNHSHSLRFVTMLTSIWYPVVAFGIQSVTFEHIQWQSLMVIKSFHTWYKNWSNTRWIQVFHLQRTTIRMTKICQIFQKTFPENFSHYSLIVLETVAANLTQKKVHLSLKSDSTVVAETS